MRSAYLDGGDGSSSCSSRIPHDGHFIFATGTGRANGSRRWMPSCGSSLLTWVAQDVDTLMRKLGVKDLRVALSNYVAGPSKGRWLGKRRGLMATGYGSRTIEDARKSAPHLRAQRASVRDRHVQ
jgi:hypothetical protein